MADERIQVYESKMTKTLDGLTKELATIRAGRANPHILDKLTVDYYGHLHRFSRWQTLRFRKLA